jgi:hypothetical protein
MVQPSTYERGKKMGAVMGVLDFANDKVRYFALGVDWRTDKKGKR